MHQLLNTCNADVCNKIGVNCLLENEFRPQLYGGKKITKCFRFSSDAMSELESEAQRKEISLNSLVNGLIIEYLEWGRFIERYGGLSFSETSFASLVRETGDISIFEKAGAEAGIKTPRRLLLMLGLSCSKENVLLLVDIICEHSISYQRYVHRLIDGKHNFLLVHNLGFKMSGWFGGYIRSMFKDLLGLEIKVTEDDDSISFVV
jgi:hypothetical protein